MPHVSLFELRITSPKRDVLVFSLRSRSLMAKREITRSDILRLAAEAQLDPRTVKRAIERGVEAMQGAVDKERIRAAAAKLKIKLE